jgi:hypothetical protein
MRLRTTAGAYAGEIRDYTRSAGLAALRVGTAEPIESVQAPEEVKPEPVPVKWGKQKARHK